MPLGAVRTHCGHHRADQLITELVDTTFTIQPRRHRGIHIAPRRLAVHPGLGSHPPQTQTPTATPVSTSRISITETSRYIQRTLHID